MSKVIAIGVIALLLYLLEQKLYSIFWSEKLNVSLTFEKEAIYEGEASSLKEVVENRKKLPLSMLNVKFTTDRNLQFQSDTGSKTTDKFYRNDIFMVGGMEKVTRTLDFTGAHRGVYSIESLDLVASDLFMVSKYSEERKAASTIYVYPKPFETQEFLKSFKQLYGELLTRRHLLEDPFELRGIREYQPYDSMKSINWKAAARFGELKVNQKNFTTQKAIRIFMNLEDNGILKREECVEASIQIAVSLCKLFLTQGMKVSVFCNAGDMFTGEKIICEANAGSRQFVGILRALTRCDTGKIYPFTETYGKMFLEHEGDSFTCIVSPNQYDDFVALVKEFKAHKGQFIWFYPVWELSDPEVCPELKKEIQILHTR